jgi:hypothetical protein
MLLNELRGDLCALGTPEGRIDPRGFETYRLATTVAWPKSPLSVHIALLAARLRNTCTPAARRTMS